MQLFGPQRGQSPSALAELEVVRRPAVRTFADELAREQLHRRQLLALPERLDGLADAGADDGGLAAARPQLGEERAQPRHGLRDLEQAPDELRPRRLDQPDLPVEHLGVAHAVVVRLLLELPPRLADERLQRDLVALVRRHRAVVVEEGEEARARRRRAGARGSGAVVHGESLHGRGPRRTAPVGPSVMPRVYTRRRASPTGETMLPMRARRPPRTPGSALGTASRRASPRRTAPVPPGTPRLWSCSRWRCHSGCRREQRQCVLAMAPPNGATAVTATNGAIHDATGVDTPERTYQASMPSGSPTSGHGVSDPVTRSARPGCPSWPVGRRPSMCRSLAARVW